MAKKSKVESLEAELKKVRAKLETKKKGLSPLEEEEKRILKELNEAKMIERTELMERENMTVDDLKKLIESKTEVEVKTEPESESE